MRKDRNGRTETEFFEHFRGLPTNILQRACTYVSQGVSYERCSKAHMAEAYAKDDYGIGRIDMAVIGRRVGKLLEENWLSARQFPVVEKWAKRWGYV